LLLGLHGQVLISNDRMMGAPMVQRNIQIDALHHFMLRRTISAFLIHSIAQLRPGLHVGAIDLSVRHMPTKLLMVEEHPLLRRRFAAGHPQIDEIGSADTRGDNGCGQDCHLRARRL
jgi:hypothetical protein